MNVDGWMLNVELADPTDYLYSKEYRNKGMLNRLLMDDSHRDDCLILVENKGWMLLEEILQASLHISSTNIKLIIHQ